MKTRIALVALSLTVLTCLAPHRANAQVSTQGKDFWVALTYAMAPDAVWLGHAPYLAVSAKKACQVTISNPATGYTTTRNAQADGWLEITDIPLAEWWPMNNGSERGAADVTGHTFPTGLHVTATEEISVFAANMLEKSFDAAIILPTAILQTDYYVQDYPPYDHKGNTSWATFCVVGTAAGTTTVTIKPTTTTMCNHAANTAFNVTLQQGQVYYVISKEKQSLTGTHITSDKPIAVFNGDVCTDVPGVISARDCLYEQAMPTDYWGTQFVVTRSIGKDANRIRVTAMENGTELKVDGNRVTYLNAGETFEFEMSDGVATEQQKKLTEGGLTIPPVYSGNAHFLQTSCPCAVYSYDVSQKYTIKSGSMVVSGQEGDPAMVWIAPIEQKINRITFGVCATNNTKRHNLNVVVLTQDTAKVTLFSKNRPKVPLTFIPLANTPYSYARTELCNTAKADEDKVYTLYCPTGFIAHVYGNGDQESYAYSVGSAAVKRAVNIEGLNYFDGYRAEDPYCVSDTLHFDAQVGTDIIDRVDWDFGDGITVLNGPAQTEHLYEVPGWYDVSATVYAHKDCPEKTYPPETVTFSYRIQRPDTLRRRSKVCEGEPWELDGQIYTEDQLVSKSYDCDSVVIYQLHVGKKSPDTYVKREERDSAKVNGKWYYSSQTIESHLRNAEGCDSLVITDLHVITCLVMSVQTPEYACSTPPASTIDIPYTLMKGDIGDAWFVSGTTRVELTRENGYFTLPVGEILPGRYSGEVQVQDTVCKELLHMPVTFQILYPNNVFNYKFGNVLAMYTADFNGGYYFTEYQWYQDGKAIEGATSSIYHTAEMFAPGTAYSVELTRSDGVKLMSCPFVIPERTINEVEELPAPAKKTMRGQRLLIEVGGREYDIYGNLVH